MEQKLNIIIVNYNTGHLLKECLESIYSTVKDQISFKITVVDNNSTDNSVSIVKKSFPGVELIENLENVGFARANNQAIKISQSQYILLLNPDTKVLSDAIARMVFFMDAHPEAGVLGCRILNPAGKLQPSCAQFPTLILEFLQNTFLDRVILGINRLNVFSSYFRHDKFREVDWMTGACLLLRKKAIDEVGLLDERFFLYYEEVDWCYRAKKEGWKRYFVPDAEVIHWGGKSTEQVLTRSLVEAFRSHYYFFKKHYNRKTRFFFRLFTVMGAWLRIVSWTVISIFMLRFRIEAQQRIKAYWNIVKLRLETRIALDVSSTRRSKAGVGYYTDNLMQVLPEVDVQRTYFFFSDRGTLEQDYEGGTNVIRKIINAGRHIVWAQLILPLILMIRRIDLLHSPAFVAPLLKTTRWVITIHDMAYYLYPDKFVKHYQTYLNLMVPRSAKRAERIIVDSQNTKKDVIDILKIDKNKIIVVYPAVNRNYRPIEDKSLLEAVKKKYNISKKFILYIGTLEPRKNIIGIIKGYYQFRQMSPDTVGYQLVIAGKKGWMYLDIFELVKELNLKEDVIFTDYVPEDDLPLLYNAAEIFVYPSIYEGFGLPPLESMACGTPVITSNVSSLPEVVGDAAIMIAPTDVDGLAQAILRVLSDNTLKQELITKGLERARKFTWERTAADISKVYNQVLGM